VTIPPVGPGGTRAVTALPRLETAIGRFLTVGTYATVVVLGVGVALMLMAGRSPLAAASPLDVGRLPADLIALRPEGFLWLGLLLVIVMPSIRVVAALVGFVRRGERRMAQVALGVLLVIVVGVVVARATEL
jgi:uncharacterized membrane protein